VEALMTRDVLTAQPDDTVESARKRMVDEGISALPVVEEGALVGIVTATDVLRCERQEALVGAVMSPHVYTLPPYADVHIAARVMRNHGVHHVVVTDNKQVVGILASYDLLELVEQHRFVMKGAPHTPGRRKTGRRGKLEKRLAEARKRAAEAPAGAPPPEDLQRERLNALLGMLTRRNAKVESHRKREGGLEADFAEQAVVRENDEVLDALSKEGRDQLKVVGEALERLDAGDYAKCADCGGEIGAERMEALPYAVTCIACARKREAAAV
jgi:RNA polymerase-binding transcription factor DksA